MDIYTIEKDKEWENGRREEEEGIIERRRRLWRQAFKVFLCSMATWTMGSMYSYPSVVSHDLSRHNTTIYGTYISLSSSEIDMTGSLVLLGSIAGTWLVAPLMMRFGRKVCFVVSASMAILGWLGVALMPKTLGILLARGLSGASTGGLTVVGNSYAIEIADPEVRGMMLTIVNLGIMLGQVVTVSVGYDARYFTVALVDVLMPLVLLLSMLYLPESPTYLVLKDREAEARQILLDLRGRSADLSAEVQSYRDLNEVKESSAGWKELGQPQVLKDLVVVSTLFILMYFTGYQVISANTSRMFEDAGSSINDSLSTIIVNAVQTVAGVVCFFLLDRFGRRKCALLSFAMMAVSLGSMSIYILLAGHEEPRPQAWIPLVCLMTTQGAVALGVNPVPFILSSEYFPTRIRALAAGICYTIGSLAGFTALQLYTPMLEAFSQAGVYAFYSSVCVLGIPFTYFFVRETAGTKVG